MYTKNLNFFVLFMILSVRIVSVQAQELAMVKDSLYSPTLKQLRPLQILYPKDYNSEMQYELLYCLDGIPNALKMEIALLQSEGFIPQNIILVGIPNISVKGINMRDHDLSPTVVGGNSGGAAQFLEFIQKELMPYMQKKLNVKPSGHSLYGASLAGLFTIYTFLKKPNLFTSYLAIDPSLWWDNFYMKKELTKLFASKLTFNNTLWIAGREGNAYHAMGIAGVDSLLQKATPKGLLWKCQAYANETHYSTMFKGFWDGMKFSYGGFYAAVKAYPASRKILIKPVIGMVLKDKAFPLICDNLGAADYIHYTTDGTEPSLNSSKLSGQQSSIQLDQDAKILLKSFGIREAYNKSVTAFFKVGKVLPSIKKTDNLTKGGLHYDFFEGEWEALPDFGKLKPEASGFTDKDFDLNGFKKAGGYACVLNGFIEIASNGYYIFTKVDGNDDSRVFIKDQLVLGLVTGLLSGNEESYIIPLEKGFYPFKVEYWRKKGGKDLQPIYIKPEFQEDFPIPTEMLYYSTN